MGKSWKYEPHGSAGRSAIPDRDMLASTSPRQLYTQTHAAHITAHLACWEDNLWHVPGTHPSQRGICNVLCVSFLRCRLMTNASIITILKITANSQAEFIQCGARRWETGKAWFFFVQRGACCALPWTRVAILKCSLEWLQILGGPSVYVFVCVCVRVYALTHFPSD